MSSLLSRRRRRAEINIVPLIDVLTILIFFFLVSMQFRERVALQLTLPKVETAGQNEVADTVVIAVDREDRIFFNGTEATEEQLLALVREQAAASTDVQVLLKVDEDTPVKRLTFVMDACREVGLNKIRLQSR